MSQQADIGLIGLAVMGENLILNMESKGFTVAVNNRTTSKIDEFLQGRGKGKKLIGAHSVEELAKVLKKPRRIMMMVRAGSAVDQLIDSLLPHLEKGDILIDGGNSNWEDSNRRTKYLQEKGILFIGSGVSGGEEGALKGPSIMPGGHPDAWPHVKAIFQGIAAKVEDGTPCCDWVGDAGSGHYVKMVHNGIEYGDMQLISEGYQLLKDIIGLDNESMAQVFERWNKTELDSYLIEITKDILRKKDDETGKYVVDLILDSAGQKGTGKWTAIAALDLGMPLTLIGEAVFARCLSAQKDERIRCSKVLPGPGSKFDPKSLPNFVDDIKDAIYASKIVSYAQGFVLLRAAAEHQKWHLNYGAIALMWRGGCIIRSKFLGKIKEAYDKNPNLQNLLEDPFFSDAVSKAQGGWRRVVATAVTHGIPVPTISSALAYYDGLRTERLPANLIQAQRDYFGAHTFERVDKPRGQAFHTNWTGHGGTTASSTYNV
eukprot:TRINITY_DN1188_c0_g2_i3.p1 TRINITY_DN1188_c0_g2~~TRINITY_DN1188_c0_g2_i3.p1  ORF type:complete len:500 (-),score=128.38 TRINITY_DN1188_c0_g2_i3:37-1497(-)